MSESETTSGAEDDSNLYEIRIKGHLDSRWVHWFEGLEVTLEENGETHLSGPLVDQAALHGVLRRVRDLGMPLLAVNQVEASNLKSTTP